MHNLTKSTSDAAVLALSLDRGAREPVHAQLAEALRRFILERRIASGARLPSSRVLALELGVSRVTVVTAFDQLIGEGYAEGRRGSGVYVAADLPEHSLQLSRLLAPLAGASPTEGGSPARPFQPAAPDLSLFPYRDWGKLLDRAWRRPSPHLIGHSDPMGWPPLRQAIADYLAAARGLACAPAQIALTSGVAESIDLLCRTLLKPGAEVALEDPGYPLMRRAFLQAGCEMRTVPLDAAGFDLSRVGASVAAAAVTPSRQYPLGLTMPLSRRLQLLDWARARGAIVIEDDYDSEYRYRGRPLPALMSLDRQGSVAYLGSFSKVLSSSLRLGYLVVPEAHAAALRRTMAELGPKASLVPQPALAEFMRSGAFASHIRRMRRLYARRQGVLVAAAEEHLKGLLEVAPESAGMHLLATLVPALARRMDDREASARAARAGVVAPALSGYYAGTPTHRGLLLGYAGFSEDALAAAARRLAQALE